MGFQLLRKSRRETEGEICPDKQSLAGIPRVRFVFVKKSICPNKQGSDSQIAGPDPIFGGLHASIIRKLQSILGHKTAKNVGCVPALPKAARHSEARGAATGKKVSHSSQKTEKH